MNIIYKVTLLFLSFDLLFGIHQTDINSCKVENLSLSESKMSAKQLAKLISVKQLGPGPMETLNPFLFCVYHKDNYPVGDTAMRVPDIKGDGQDFDPNKEFRMYHGREIPGFPQHPHRGFETITATLEGVIDHTDSLGNAGRYGNGDLQWMTAGRGVVHGENFPLINDKGPNPLKLFQIWLNLPKKNKMVDPDFVMHWSENIKHVSSVEDKYKLTVFAGEFNQVRGQEPTVHSWAKNKENEVAVWYIQINNGGRIELPPAAHGNDINRALYIIEGKGAEVNNKSIKRASATFSTFVHVSADLPTVVSADNGNVHLLMLQGRPILGKDEKVVQQGPFVMNSQQEIMQTFDEYRRTRFGGWPWEKDAVVFPKEKGRFAKINGKEYFPPVQ